VGAVKTPPPPSQGSNDGGPGNYVAPNVADGRKKIKPPLKQQLRNYLIAKGITISPNDMIHCLWHEDKTPSCKVNDDFVHCFSCRESGDIFKITAALIGVAHNRENFREIANDIERTLGLPEWKPNKQSLRSPLKLSKSVIFQNELLRDFARAIDADDFGTAFHFAQILFGLSMLPQGDIEKKPDRTVKTQTAGYGIRGRP